MQGLLSEDNVFAVLPVSVLLFTGADLLGQSGIPTFGWNINAEWGSEQAPGPPNLFGEKGSYLCFTCPAPARARGSPRRSRRRRSACSPTASRQSADCAKGLQASFDKYPSAKIEFPDTSLAFGVTDLSNDVQQMKDKGVDFVTTCMDNNGTLTLAKEMKKQGLNAKQYLPNAYNQKFIEENAPFFQGSYVLTFFTPFEVKQKPKGLKDFQKWMKKDGYEQNENSMAGWINADQFVTGLGRPGPTSPARRSSTRSTRRRTSPPTGSSAASTGACAPGRAARGVHRRCRRSRTASSCRRSVSRASRSSASRLNPLPDKLQSQPTVKA